MNTAQKGNAAERFIIKHLTEQGWICASRRHIPGPGDILAYHPRMESVWLAESVWLIEAKERKNVWQGFRREARREMLELVAGTRIVPWVCNKVGRELVWIPASEWPA